MGFDINSVSFIFTTLGLLFGLLSWLQITPSRLRNLAIRYFIQNKLIYPMLFTLVGFILTILAIINNITNWWVYIELLLPIVFAWLSWQFVKKDEPSTLLTNLISFGPLAYLLPGFARLQNAFSTNFFDSASPLLLKWGVIGALIFYSLLIGFTFGLSFRYHGINKQLKDCTECQSIQKKAKEAIEFAEKIIQ